MTRTLIDRAGDALLIGWAVLMIALAILAVWCFADITRAHGRGHRRRRRSRTDINERPPRARVG